MDTDSLTKPLFKKKTLKQLLFSTVNTFFHNHLLMQYFQTGSSYCNSPVEND